MDEEEAQEQALAAEGAAEWAARVLALVGTACAQAAGNGHRTEWVFLVTSISAPSAARR